MNKEDTKKCIEIMQAYVDGKEIEELYVTTGRYVKTDDPLWNWNGFDVSYEIKPEPKIIPYKTVAELEDAIENHSFRIKTAVGNELTIQGYGCTVDSRIPYIDTFMGRLYLNEDGLKRATFADGAPFGKEVEE